jgi:hypothetical protein
MTVTVLFSRFASKENATELLLALTSYGMHDDLWMETISVRNLYLC